MLLWMLIISTSFHQIKLRHDLPQQVKEAKQEILKHTCEDLTRKDEHAAVRQQLWAT